jgi:hypothetical protein
MSNMSSHLAPQRFIEAIDATDGTLAPAEQEHLRECAACRGEVEALRAVLREVEAAPAADPSPLFWDHFGDRVRQATAATPVGPTWWETWLRPVALAGAALAVVALALLARPGASRLGPDTMMADGGADAMAALDDESWDLVVSLAEDLDWDDVQGVAAPRVGAADALLAQLSIEERAALARLLKAEMGGFE